MVVDSDHVVLEARVGAALERELQEKQREVSLLDLTMSCSPTYPRLFVTAASRYCCCCTEPAGLWSVWPCLWVHVGLGSGESAMCRVRIEVPVRDRRAVSTTTTTTTTMPATRGAAAN